MHNHLLISVALFLAMIFSKNGHAQNLHVQNRIVPTSPQAAMFQRFGDSPVSEYTGTPQIEVPIHEIKLNRFSLPITLSYHAGGNRVEDIASWVGLGWSLQAAGAVTREIRGMPDDGLFGYSTTSMQTQNFVNGNMSPEEFKDYLWRIESMLLDAEPDIYHFNFAGHSGRFFID